MCTFAQYPVVSLSINEAVLLMQCADLYVEMKRGQYYCSSWDLLRVFPSTPRPPYMKSVWSDMGVMVCIERPRGEQYEQVLLVERRVEQQSVKHWSKKLLQKWNMWYRSQLMCVKVKNFFWGGVTIGSRSRFPGLSRTGPTLPTPVNNHIYSILGKDTSPTST